MAQMACVYQACAESEVAPLPHPNTWRIVVYRFVLVTSFLYMHVHVYSAVIDDTTCI